MDLSPNGQGLVYPVVHELKQRYYQSTLRLGK